jgi:hypothetical protein
MSHGTFVACALVVLALELLALGPRSMPGPSSAEIERMVAAELQVREGPVSDVRCVRRAVDAATCVALMYEGWRIRVAASIDRDTGQVASKIEP